MASLQRNNQLKCVVSRGWLGGEQWNVAPMNVNKLWAASRVLDSEQLKIWPVLIEDCRMVVPWKSSEKNVDKVMEGRGASALTSEAREILACF